MIRKNPEYAGSHLGTTGTPGPWSSRGAFIDRKLLGKVATCMALNDRKVWDRWTLAALIGRLTKDDYEVRLDDKLDMADAAIRQLKAWNLISYHRRSRCWTWIGKTASERGDT